jgi:hypothetical protein
MPDRLWSGALASGADTMAVEDDYQRHLRGWLAFGRLLRWAVAAIVIVLVLLGYFLV